MIDGLPWAQIVTGLFTLAGGAGGAVATYLTTRNKHRHEKTWERRVEFYSHVVVSLTRAVQIGEGISEAYQEDAERADADPYVQSRIQELWGHYHAAWAKLDENYLLASDAFIAAMTKLREAMDSIDADDIPPERHQAAMEAIRSRLPEIARQATREVRP